VAAVRYSIRAERDLMEIADYTLNRWGVDQALRYLDELEACCCQLAASPALGRACDDILPRLRRMEHGKHVIFYRDAAGGILVSRILHQSMLPDRQPMRDDETK
jgi:toxin ParE1/3/4